MNINLRSTRDYGVENGVKIVAYGRAGRGKTVLCSTCPAPVIISAESGLLSLAGYNLPFLEVNTLADLQDVYRWCKDSQESRQFQTICIDSVTEVGEKVLANAKIGKKDPRQAYGEMIEEVTKVIKDFRDLRGRHVYMSAKLGPVDQGNGMVLNGPMMPGKTMGVAMPYFPDELFKIEINDGAPPAVMPYRYLQCQPDFQNEAKDRSGVLDAVEEPHLGKVITKITLARGKTAG